MRRTIGLFGLLSSIAIVLAACTASSSASPAGAASPSSVGAGGSPIGGAELVGTNWVLGDLPGQVLADVRPTIAFTGDGTVTGNAGCNTFNGSYTAEGSNLTFSPLATTRMACEGAAGTIEQAFLPALQATTAYEITSDGNLVLTSGSTTLTFSVQD
jgi:heat shock protein HslJ